MKSILRTAVLAFGLLSGAAFAAEQTATLAVKNVTCASCGPIVKRALARVPGVSHVTVSESGDIATATIIFDDTRTNVAALIEATTNAGYPSQVAR